MVVQRRDKSGDDRYIVLGVNLGSATGRGRAQIPGNLRDIVEHHSDYFNRPGNPVSLLATQEGEIEPKAIVDNFLHGFDEETRWEYIANLESSSRPMIFFPTNEWSLVKPSHAAAAKNKARRDPKEYHGTLERVLDYFTVGDEWFQENVFGDILNSKPPAFHDRYVAGFFLHKKTGKKVLIVSYHAQKNKDQRNIKNNELTNEKIAEKAMDCLECFSFTAACLGAELLVIADWNTPLKDTAHFISLEGKFEPTVNLSHKVGQECFARIYPLENFPQSDAARQGRIDKALPPIDYFATSWQSHEGLKLEECSAFPYLNEATNKCDHDLIAAKFSFPPSIIGTQDPEVQMANGLNKTQSPQRQAHTSQQQQQQQPASIPAVVDDNQAGPNTEAGKMKDRSSQQKQQQTFDQDHQHAKNAGKRKQGPERKDLPKKQRRAPPPPARETDKTFSDEANKRALLDSLKKYVGVNREKAQRAAGGHGKTIRVIGPFEVTLRDGKKMKIKTVRFSYHTGQAQTQKPYDIEVSGMDDLVKFRRFNWRREDVLEALHGEDPNPMGADRPQERGFDPANASDPPAAQRQQSAAPVVQQRQQQQTEAETQPVGHHATAAEAEAEAAAKAKAAAKKRLKEEENTNEFRMLLRGHPPLQKYIPDAIARDRGGGHWTHLIPSEGFEIRGQGEMRKLFRNQCIPNCEGCEKVLSCARAGKKKKGQSETPSRRNVSTESGQDAPPPPPATTTDNIFSDDDNRRALLDSVKKYVGDDRRRAMRTTAGQGQTIDVEGPLEVTLRDGKKMKIKTVKFTYHRGKSKEKKPYQVMVDTDKSKRFSWYKEDVLQALHGEDPQGAADESQEPQDDGVPPAKKAKTSGDSQGITALEREKMLSSTEAAQLNKDLPTGLKYLPIDTLPAHLQQGQATKGVGKDRAADEAGPRRRREESDVVSGAENTEGYIYLIGGHYGSVRGITLAFGGIQGAELRQQLKNIFVSRINSKYLIDSWVYCVRVEDLGTATDWLHNQIREYINRSAATADMFPLDENLGLYTDYGGNTLSNDYCLALLNSSIENLIASPGEEVEDLTDEVRT